MRGAGEGEGEGEGEDERGRERKTAPFRLMLLAATTISVLSGAAAWAAPVCFPAGGGGVPGQPGLPDWWTGSAPFDDPRWLGSYGFGHGTVKMDALVETTGATKYLVLKWRIKPDPGPAGPGDLVWVGLYNPTTTVATVLKFTRDALVTTSAGAVGAGVMTATAYARTGSTGLFATTTMPLDIRAKARLDTFCGTSDPIICDEWILRLRIPTGALGGGIDLPDTFSLWYQADMEHAGTFDRAKWPNGVADVDSTADPLVFPPPATWNEVNIASASACVAGISIQSSDITVSNGLGAGTSIDVNSANTFHAKPINNTGTVYNPNSIKARFRIADWGSAVGDSPRWLTVPVPSCENATGAGAPGSIGGAAHFDLTCPWTLTPGQKCAYRPDLAPPGCTPDPGPRYAHQCILAELSSAAAPIAFSTDSAWNNFNFASASKLDRKARIDIGTRGPRDVYVYVGTQNMPEKVEPPPPNDVPNGGGSSRGHGLLSGGMRDRLGGLSGIVPGRVTAKEAEALRGLIAAGRLTHDELAQLMPTYTAYVWHDSGTTVKTAAGTSKLLVPQPSFTLFVSHDGPLAGWKHALTGIEGASVTEIARDFYRVAVDGTGMVEVLTSVEAVERDDGVTPTTLPIPPWLIALIILAVIFVFWIIRRRTT